jgi:hypothetical protein
VLRAERESASGMPVPCFHAQFAVCLPVSAK